MPPASEPGDAERATIEELLGAEPIQVDDVVRQSALPAAVVNGVLLELELAGKVERHPGNRFARLYKAPANPLCRRGPCGLRGRRNIARRPPPTTSECRATSAKRRSGEG